MTTLNRRSFLHRTAGAVAATAFMSAPVRAAASGRPRATDIRVLGKSGLQCSYLGIGTGIRGSGQAITEQTMKLTGEQYVALLEHAYARGITYFDLADRYGSHHFMRLAMRKSVPRDKVLILSKVWSREPEAVKNDLERMRAELESDYIDIVLIHCIRHGEEDWPETLKPTMDVLTNAKAKGHIKAHGVSCHVLPALERAVDEPWCDVVLARINPLGKNMDGPVEKVVPILKAIRATGTGLIAMKVLGEGDPEVVARMDESLRFAADLGVLDAMTIGFMSPEELDEMVTRIDAVADS